MKDFFDTLGTFAHGFAYSAALVFALAAGTLAGSPAQACYPGEPSTYSFYTTSDATPIDPAPRGLTFQDNTDYEDDAATCDTEALGNGVTVYTCAGERPL